MRQKLKVAEEGLFYPEEKREIVEEVLTRKERDLGEVFERMNPHFSYVAGSKEKLGRIFGIYFNKKHPKLTDLILLLDGRNYEGMEDVLDLERFPDYFSIKDSSLRRVVVEFIENPNYRILERDGAKIRLRTYVPNKEAIDYIIRSILLDFLEIYKMKKELPAKVLNSEVKEIMERLSEVRDILNVFKKFYSRCIENLVDPSDPYEVGEFAKIAYGVYGLSKNLQKILYGTEEVWPLSEKAKEIAKVERE